MRLLAALFLAMLKRPLRPIVFVTGNAKKLEEVQQILSKGSEPLPFEVTSQKARRPSAYVTYQSVIVNIVIYIVIYMYSY